MRSFALLNEVAARPVGCPERIVVQSGEVDDAFVVALDAGGMPCADGDQIGAGVERCAALVIKTAARGWTRWDLRLKSGRCFLRREHKACSSRPNCKHPSE